MVHTPFFKAGIAGDGAYNRTLTPLGFQSERRDLWEAPNVYLNMSPFLYAQQPDRRAADVSRPRATRTSAPIPTNSIRLYHALNGLGKTTALYMYPLEDHGPASTETLLDLWARWGAWLDKYVKNPQKAEPKKITTGRLAVAAFAVTRGGQRPTPQLPTPNSQSQRPRGRSRDAWAVEWLSWEIRPFSWRISQCVLCNVVRWPRASLAGASLVCTRGLRGAANGEPTKLLRMPTVSATQIAFAYANNIWTVERAGGMARRLTSFQGQTTNPHFSPDGKWIAFSGEYAGNIDVYVVPADGGEPKRLTWHPGADSVQGWTPDGKSILFASARATWAPSGAPRFWTVPVEGGVEEPMPLPRAYQGKISPTGTHIAYRMNNSWDDERRNYRGGQNRPIWIVDLKTFDLVSPPWTDSKDIDPVWVGDTVYFLSDRDGVSNVWSFETKTKKLAQVTKFTDFDVKTIDAERRRRSCSSRPARSTSSIRRAARRRSSTSRRPAISPG